ncbi:MAG: hypothetical protein ACW98K_16050 [Candidatus Kariarchaeaceae archaeon]
MKIAIIIVISILLSLSSTQVDAELNQPEGMVVIWIADTLIYSDSFPVVLASYEHMFANISFETSYMKYNISSNLHLDPTIFWIDLPASYSGSDELKIFADSELLGSYPFNWKHSAPFLSHPNYIIYTDKWYSYWIGHGELSGRYDKNDSYNISHTVYTSDVGKKYARLYENDFNIYGDYGFTSILSKLNLSNAHKFQSWRYSGLVYDTDQMDLSQKVILGFDEREVKLEINIYDDKSRTVSSEAIIGNLFDTLNSTTHEIINEVGTEVQSTQKVSIMNFQYYLLPLIISMIIKKKLSKCGLTT